MTQIKTNTKEWLKAALIRAIKTMAQTALGMITVGAAIADIDWLQVASVAVVAGIYSLLTSVAGLPEVGVDDGLQSAFYDIDGHPIDVYTYSDGKNTWVATKENSEKEDAKGEDSEGEVKEG